MNDAVTDENGKPASPTSPPETSVLNVPLPIRKYTRKPVSSEKQFLDSLGIGKAVATRLLADGKTDRFLNTRITARVYVVHQFNSAEEVMKAQKSANVIGINPAIDIRSRVAALDVAARCAMALARLSEVAMTTARNMDAPENANDPKVVKPIQNNYFAYPPVAPVSNREPDSAATNGESTPLNITAKVKATE